MKHVHHIALCAVVAMAGCTPGIEDRVTASRGAQFYAENCAGCHGPEARGFGGPPITGTRPPDLTLLSQRNGGTFPEFETMATIYGPAYHRSRGTIMPEFGADDLGPLVVVEVEDGIGTPIPADLVALSEYLRSIQR